MVNAKHYAFKVQPQQPNCQASTQAYGAVINCRKPGGKRAAKEAKAVLSHHVTFVNVEGALKRKRDQEEESNPHDATSSRASPQLDESGTSTPTLPDRSICHQRLLPLKLPRPKKTKAPSKGVDMDCWFIILSFSDPAQLLDMRRTIPSCYHFLNSNPTLWKHSRTYHYGHDLPEPSSELTEFQFADLRHGHGCQSCQTPNTRKTYWAFLRRWCKECLRDKHCREHEALAMLRGALNEDLSFLHSCLPAGIYDSWGNFVGVGPASTHALKTVYLRSDVKKLVDDYNAFRARHEDPSTWVAELHAWLEPKIKLVEERKVFAKEMESWEELMRSARSQDYTLKKAARKKYYQTKASELKPAISASELECCPSFRRAIRIPKDPNSTSWLQLKPKLEKEAAELKMKGGPRDEGPCTSSTSGTSTPLSVISVVERPQPQPEPESQQQQQQPRYALPSIGRSLALYPAHGLPTLPAHNQYGLSPPHSHGLRQSQGQSFALPQFPGIAQPYAQISAPSHSNGLPRLQNPTFTQRHSHNFTALHNQVHAASRDQAHAHQALPAPHSHMF